MAFSHLTKTHWIRTVSGVTSQLVDTIAQQRTHVREPPDPPLSSQLSSRGFPGSMALSVQVSKRTPGCREQLLESWEIRITDQCDGFDSNLDKVLRDAQILVRTSELLVRSLPSCAGTEEVLACSLAIGREKRHFGTGKQREIRVFPSRPVSAKSPYGAISWQVTYLTSLPDDQFLPFPLGQRTRLVSLDSSDPSEVLFKPKSSAISSLAQKAVEADYHPAGYLPLAHSLTMFEEQSTFSSDRDFESDLGFYEEKGTDVSENAEIALFLDYCEKERGNGLFASSGSEDRGRRSAVGDLVRRARTEVAKFSCKSA